MKAERIGRLGLTAACWAAIAVFASGDFALFTVRAADGDAVQTNRLVEITSLWRYHVGKEDLGTAWKAPAYDDGAWATGGGLLYVENSNLPAPKTTALPLTARNLPTTTYFRTRFTNELAAGSVISLVANTVIDDGAVVYLNGEEVFRVRMPDGAPAYSTFATRAVGNAAWEGPFEIPATGLHAGVNVLAVEVHQINATSSDIVMGLTLDAVGQPHDTDPPVIADLFPARGATVASLAQIEVQFSEPVQGVDAADLRVNDFAAASVVVLAPDHYRFQFPQPSAGTVKVTWAADHGITDFSTNANPFVGVEFSYVLDPSSYVTRLDFLSVTQSSDASPVRGALKATDGNEANFSLTADLPGSYWQGELGRPHPVKRVVLVNRPAPDDAAMEGLVLRLFNLDDQIVFETELTNPGPAAVAVVSLPEDTVARSLWIGLPGDRTNGAGNHRVGLAEVRLFGAPNIPYAPDPFVPGGGNTNAVRVWQSSEYPGFPAANAVDGELGNFTHTDDLADSYWMADLGRVVPIDRIEVVNRRSCCDARLGGLVLRLYDGSSNSVASTVLTNPGLGKTWTHAPPPGMPVRWLRVGLENGALNDDENHYVSLAEVRVFSGGANVLNLASSSPVPVFPNLASSQPSYMLRLEDSVPPASNANDDDYATQTKTTSRTVDGYWEVDLGETLALYGVRAIAASGIGGRLTNATVRLFDANHDSVHAQPVTGTPDVFDVDLNGPHFARYVRVGLENKQRTDPSGGIEWYIGFREVEVFGRPTNEVGILAFTASTNQTPAGQPVTLSWAVEDVRRVELHPSQGSVGAHTAADGAGKLAVEITNATEFVLLATNAAGIFSRAVGVETPGHPLTVRFSELVAENQYSLKDGYGDAPDWIELRNTGNDPVNLAGWGLSDDPARPMQWTFPDATLAPHDTLIVFASGRGEPVDPAGHLHAKFALEKRGETLVLTAADGTTTLDSVTYPALATDLAYGRDLDGDWTFLEPTPGTVNAAPTYFGWLKPLDWSHSRGFYETNFVLTLTNNNPGATVLYSLDGTEPHRPYSGGLDITGTTVVRAQVVQAGYQPARPQTMTFLFVDDVITSPVMDRKITQDPRYAPRLRAGLLALPSISLALPGQPEYQEQEGSLEILWPDGRQPVQINCGLSRFGNAWTKFQKRSFRIKARARYGRAKLKAPLFDGFDRGVQAARSFDKLDLRSGSQDMVQRGFYMAGRFVEDTMLDMGSLNPHGRFVHVYLNGVYWGQYDCRELLEEHFLADYLGGSDEDYVTVRGNDNVGSDFVIGTPDPPNLQPWEYARSVRNSYGALRDRVDVPHLIDFMLLWSYGNCESEYRAGGPILPGSGFKFWIADADGFLRTSALGKNRVSKNGPGSFFAGLRSENDPDFKALVADRIYQHFFNDGALTPAVNDARLAARMQEIRDSLLAECARWGYRTPANWESAAANIRSQLFPARTAQLLGYLRNAGLYPAFDPPAFNQYGGLVAPGFQPALTAAAGAIYYTLDGTDPRLPGDGVSPAARVWSPGAVTVTNELTLSARLRTSAGKWSALARPHFVVSALRAPTARDLWITEIHYNPDGSDDFEFVELRNASPNSLDLSGVSLNNAVRFLFPNGFTLPPGAFVLVVEDPAAFAARYQTPGQPDYFADLEVAGKWSGALSNGGETLALLAADGTELSAVPYKPTGDWPARADGKGSSLELLAPPAGVTDEEARALMADGRNWRDSSLYGGSPGRFDSFVGSVRINEVAFDTGEESGWIELYNDGEQPVDLAGATLTDDLKQPSRWVFSASAELPPGEFLRLTTEELGFAFSPSIGHAWLLQWNGGEVIRFLDSADWPAVSPEVTVGRFLRSDGVRDFPALRVATPEAPNTLPRVGPVVISEILFAPRNGNAEFIELANFTDAPVPLFDPLRPTNRWHLDGVGSFEFPADTTLAEGGILIICSTDPAAFRAQYGVSAAVPVFGPWNGALDHDGETLKLLRPGTPELDGVVPWYRVDRVAWRTTAPWPAVVPGGSLVRLPLEAYGNDPVNWRASPPDGTPGQLPANRPPVVSVEGGTSVPQGGAFELTLVVTDPDAPWQTISVIPEELPLGSSFDPATGTLSWTPSATQGMGEFPVRFTVRDSSRRGNNETSVAATLHVTSSLRLAARYEGSQLLLSFPAQAGETYRIETTTDVASGDWQPFREITATKTGTANVTDIAPPVNSARFYRLVWNR